MMPQYARKAMKVTSAAILAAELILSTPLEGTHTSAGVYPNWEGSAARAQSGRGSRALQERELYDDLAALRCSGGSTQELVSDLRKLAALKIEQCHYADAEPLLLEAVAASRKCLTDPGRAIWPLLDLGDVWRVVGEYAKSERCLLESYSLVKQHPGTDEAELEAYCLNEQALLYDKWGNFKLAEAKAAMAVKAARKTSAATDGRLGIYMTVYADTLRQQGKYSQALPCLQDAVKILEHFYGSQSAYLATAINNLGALHFWMGDYKASEPLLSRGLRIRELALGNDHPDVANSLTDLACLYYQQGRLELAERLFSRALQIRELKLGRKHPETANVLCSLGGLYQLQGKRPQAEIMLARAVQIGHDSLGEGSPDFARYLNALASLYIEEGKLEDARSLLKSALKIRLDAFGRANVDVASTFRTLGKLCIATKDYAGAQEWLQQSLEALKATVGMHDVRTASTLDLAGACLLKQRKLKESEELYTQALQIRTKIQEPAHLAIALEYAQLGEICRLSKRFEDGKGNFEHSLSLCKRSLGPALLNPNVPIILQNYAQLMLEAGHEDQSKRLTAQAQLISEQLAGRLPKKSQTQHNSEGAPKNEGILPVFGIVSIEFERARC